MNVLLLGNGFDIYHHLPTNYHNFLNVANFLHDHYNEGKEFIGDVFSDKRIQDKDPYIAKCYKEHQKVYDTVILSPTKAKEIIDLCRDNLWFTYFTQSFNKELGWIDFEKEIAFVLKVFNKFLLNVSVIPSMPNGEADACYILNHFGFFLKTTTDGFIGIPTTRIKEKYIIEYPKGSKNLEVNKDLIISTLSSMLDDVAKALKLYLDCFVNITIPGIAKEHNAKKCQAIANIDHTVSFNYTNTYEKMYSSNKIYHLHGDVDQKIIIGVNPDTSDSIETIDTSFVSFKKYYQRTLFETDHEYFKWVNDINETKEDFCLTVMGHSLDITDKDIIIELFDHAREIYVLYHNEEAKKSYIANLIKIFGKQRFDDLRRNKNLTFYSLNMDFTNFAEHLRSNSDEVYMMQYGDEKNFAESYWEE